MDHLDAEVISARMQSSSKKLNDMHVNVGKARVVRSMFSDRKKNLLAKHTVFSLGSMTKSETIARGNLDYIKELDGLVAQAEAAEITIAEYDGVYASFEAARSLLSYNRESLRQLEG